MQLVERIQVGTRRGDDDVGIGAVAVDDAPALGKACSNLALRIGAGGDGVDRVKQKFRAAPDDAFDCLEGRIDRTAATGQIGRASCRERVSSLV